VRTVTVAVIGAGRIGAYHAETLAGRLPGVRLQAVADPNEEAARRLLARLDREDVRYVRDYQELLTDPDLEAVVVATPGPTHPEVIIAAAEAGKHVFCEKPLAYTLEEADRALAAVARAGVLLQIGFQRRFDAGFQRARALVAEGALGTVYLVRSLTRDPALTAPASIPPGAIFRETLIHDFDVLRWLAGSEVVEVYALADALIAPEYRARGCGTRGWSVCVSPAAPLDRRTPVFRRSTVTMCGPRFLARGGWSRSSRGRPSPPGTTRPRAWSSGGFTGTWRCSARLTPPNWPILSPASVTGSRRP